MNNHIKLFVNEYTLNLGAKGREAIIELFRIAGRKRSYSCAAGKDISYLTLISL